MRNVVIVDLNKIEKDVKIKMGRMNLIEIVECEFKDSCQKYSEFCFNEYKDVCSTRFVLTLSKVLRKTQ